MFNQHDLRRNECMLTGSFRRQGYDWWWHSFTAENEETGEEKAFFIEYFLCNPDLAEDVPVLGQAKENKRKGKKPSYLMVKAGCWGEEHLQLHRFIPWKEVELHPNWPYAIRAKDCYASEERITGCVVRTERDCKIHPEYMSDAGRMSWDLKIDKQVAFNVGYGTSELFCRLKAFEMYWHAEGMKSKYEGSVILNGIKYTVKPETSYGYADKNWGCNFTSPWIWLSSNDLVSRISGKKLTNSVFDIGGGRPKVFGVPLERQLLGAFWYEGKEYEFNFSKFWTGTKTKFNCKETKDEIVWRIIQENHKAMMKTEIRCKKKDMLLVNYEAPDGTKRHNRLWNGGNGVGRVKLYEKVKGMYLLVDDINVYHTGCEYGEYDR